MPGRAVLTSVTDASTATPSRSSRCPGTSSLAQMALPACHKHYQFFVTPETGRLHGALVQRSADAFLGLPWNLCNLALVTTLLAQQTGYLPGELVWFGLDVHLYAASAPVLGSTPPGSTRSSASARHVSSSIDGGMVPTHAAPPIEVQSREFDGNAADDKRGADAYHALPNFRAKGHRSLCTGGDSEHHDLIGHASFCEREDQRTRCMTVMGSRGMLGPKSTFYAFKVFARTYC